MIFVRNLLIFQGKINLNLSLLFSLIYEDSFDLYIFVKALYLILHQSFKKQFIKNQNADSFTQKIPDYFDHHLKTQNLFMKIFYHIFILTLVISKADRTIPLVCPLHFLEQKVSHLTLPQSQAWKCLWIIVTQFLSQHLKFFILSQITYQVNNLLHLCQN